MAYTGNRVANEHFEAHLAQRGVQRPSPRNVEGKPTEELTRFIRDKYSHKFARPGSSWPPAPPPELTHSMVRFPQEGCDCMLSGCSVR